MKIKLISAAVRSKSKWSQIMTLSLLALAAATPQCKWLFPQSKQGNRRFQKDTSSLKVSSSAIASGSGITLQSSGVIGIRKHISLPQPTGRTN